MVYEMQPFLGYYERNEDICIIFRYKKKKRMIVESKEKKKEVNQWRFIIF
jgi:hypothetical protein